LQRFRRLGWATSGLLSAFVLWTLIATGWSASAEQTVTELGRVATYLGFFVLGLCALRRDTIRPLVAGIAAAIGLVSLLAVLSRLYPGAFPTNQVVEFFRNSASRLNYPLNYANGTGNFVALGLPLLLAVSARARSLAVQGLSAAALPVVAVAIVMTASRGAVLTAIIAVAVFYALAPDRLPKIVTGVVAAAGSAIVIAGFLDRQALRENLSSPLAVSQRHQLMLLLVLVCAGVALLQVAIGLAFRHTTRPRMLSLSRRRAGQVTLAGLIVALIVAIAAGVPGQLRHQWNVFKETDVTGAVSHNAFAQLGTVAGSHRYQYWQAAVHAFKSKPADGIGPGTFQFYWAQHRSIDESVRNAHSLYLETLAEYGVIGFLPLAALLLAVLVAGVARSRRAPPLARLSLAAVTAAFAGFLASAAYDWMWQLACAPVVALLLGAAIVTHRPPAEDAPQSSRRRWVARGLLAAGAVAAIVAIAIPYAMTSALRASQAEANTHNLRAALSDALTAQSLEPYAASPRLQRALVLEQAHHLGAARLAIAQAAAREPTNWSIWVVRARIDAESGHAIAAVRDYRRAHQLNPLSKATAE
jgi:O-antigen ligase